MTLICEASAPCARWAAACWPRRCCWPPAAAAASRRRTSQPTRIIAFGDETSSILDIDGNVNGRKYSVNGTVSATDPTLDCRQQPDLDPERRAASTACVFPQCNPAGTAVVDAGRAGSAPPSARAPPTSRRRSTPSWPRARFRDGDLVTVLVGANDVLAAVRAVPGRQRGPAHRQRRGRRRARSAAQVNRLADTGAKVHRLDHPRRRLHAVRARRARGAHRHRPRSAADPAPGASASTPR